MATQTTEHSLDELAKELASGTLSRGKAIRWMGGALLGAALASLPGVALADDDCRRLGRECRRDSQCCSRNCIRRGDDKVCACPEGQSRCGDRCVNLKTNEGHCGSCSERCATNQTCCNGNCVNLQKNENHCGECFNRCAEGEQCVDEACSGGEPICTPSCPSGCECGERADGTGTVCTDCTTGCALVTSCEQCSPGTICVVEVPGNPPTGFLCGNPCQSCAQNGSTCMANDQCCSGNCSGGICACPAGSVELSNGTCVTPCSGPCPGCFSCAQAISDNYCVNLDGSLAPCATDSECLTGEFCSGFICRVACTPSAPPV
jgi:Stigma-specific protein, Stig1